MSAKYERLPTTPNSPPSTSSSRSSSPSPTQTTFSQPLMTKSRAEAILANQELTRELQRKTDRDPRFNVPKPSTWKRVSLLVFIVALVWLAISLRMAAVKREPPVVHANRYSKEYKFRPAASPVITERLKDGRKRIRGAHPSL